MRTGEVYALMVLEIHAGISVVPSRQRRERRISWAQVAPPLAASHRCFRGSRMTQEKTSPAARSRKEEHAKGRFMIYGATGYTGKLVTRRAKALGLAPLLAGRNAARLGAVAADNGLKHRVVDLADGAQLRDALAEVDAVLHLAGPFSQTSAPMVEACLAMGKHYLDITGEIDVFEACARRGDAAKEAGIAILPGCGFDVVPSDCLAAHVKRRLPDAQSLSLAIGGMTSLSRGTAKTAIEMMASGVRVRRQGRIVALDTPPRRDFDFGRGARPAVAVSWGDVATAFHSTGIPDITVYFRTSREIAMLAGMTASGPLRWVLGLEPMQRLLQWQTGWLPEGPSEARRTSGRAVLIADAANAAGVTVRSRLTTPDPYALTAETAVEIARRAAQGEIEPGFQTPSLAFGADFILGFAGCTREDVDR
jgi:short subunit dehydrogenase-like uncharacterized protein